MNTEDFIDILEKRDLVPATALEGIREKLQQGNHRITAKSVLKFLVMRDLISRKQAKQLLDTTLTVATNAESSILGILPTQILSEAEEPKQETSSEEVIPTLAPVESIEPIKDDHVLAESSGLTVGELDGQEELGSFIAESSSISSVPSPAESFVGTATIEKETKEEGEKKSKGSKKKKREKKSEWDSPLLLLGGGGLVVLVVVGLIFSVLLNRESADEILNLAEEYFDGSSYTQAISQYEKFVETFPRHPQYSSARVRLGMAKLWKATSSTTRFEDSLATAKQVLDDLKDESDFASAQRDLASLLPKIAQGLANQAEQASEVETIALRLEQTEAALSLCANTKYIPKTYRVEETFDEINQTVLRVRRGQEQKSQLGTSLAEIQAAIDSRDTAKAYQIHRQLLLEVPALLHNEALAAKVKDISAAEKLEVEFIEEARTAETTPRPTNVVATLALAERRGSEAAGAEGAFSVRVDGAVYGLDAANGAVLWRKFVGFDPTSTPTMLPNGDALVVDAIHHDLLCLQGNTGELVWRLTFDGPILRPVINGQQLLVVEESGKLHLVDASSGNSSGHVRFGQSLPVPPTVSKQGKRIYLVGSHSSVFEISTEDFSCLSVFNLGHQEGAVLVPPVAILNKLFVTVNTGVTSSQLQVLAVDEQGMLTEITTTRRQDGLINTGMHVAGRRLVVLTTSGQVSVYEVGSEAGKNSLTLLASREAERGSPLARFGWLHEGHIWTAGSRLSKLEILPTGNRLPIRNLDRDYLGDTFDYPLQSVANLLIHVRRPANNSGVIVAAMEPSEGKALWEVELAVPPAGAPGIDAQRKRLVAATASGATYIFDRKSIGRRVQDQAARVSQNKDAIKSIIESADLGEGRLAIASPGTKTLLHFQPSGTDATEPVGQLKQISLASPASTSAVPWRDGFIVPTQIGQVYYFGSENGEQLGSPFQPPLVPEAKYSWLTPAVFGTGEDSRFVLSDGSKNIYLINHVSQPKPHLLAEAEAEIGESTLNTRLAVVGNIVCAGTDSGHLAQFQLPSLTAGDAVDLGCQIEWGPHTVGEFVLMSTDTDELICLDQQFQITWRQPLKHGRPTGVPLSDNDTFFVLWQSGGLSQIGLADGTEVNHVAFDHPVVAGPVPFGKRLVLSSYDGTLLVINRP